MTAGDQPRMVAIVTEAERTAMVAAAEQLSLAVGGAMGTSWPVQLRLALPDEADIPEGAILVSSLLADMADNEPVETVVERWRERIARCRAAGHDRILLCNLFRHVEGRTPATIERIRRLNLMAIELSRELGFEIVDIDRLLALCGARTIGADYRGTSHAATRLIGHAVAAAILDGDMDAWIDPAVQHRAGAAHGGVRDIFRLLERHVHVRSAA